MKQLVQDQRASDLDVADNKFYMIVFYMIIFGKDKRKEKFTNFTEKQKQVGKGSSPL